MKPNFRLWNMERNVECECHSLVIIIAVFLLWLLL